MSGDRMGLALLIHPTLKPLPVDYNPASDAEGGKAGLLHQLISRGPGDVISLSCISVFMSICCVHTYIFQLFRTYVHRILPKNLMYRNRLHHASVPLVLYVIEAPIIIPASIY